MVAERSGAVAPDLRGVLRRIALEASPVVVVVFAAIVAVGHIVNSTWGDVFLYSADSIVLPLVEESLRRGEPFEWVFSSQNFLFPEGLLYFLSTAFTDSPRVALITNAVLNVVCLYVLFRLIAHQLAHHSRHRFVEISISIAATLLLVIYVLLEPGEDINRGGIATLFLFTTYYYGVVLAGLLTILLVLWTTRVFSPQPWARRRLRVYRVASIALVAVCAFSNPLYLVQVVAPLALAAVVLVLLSRMSRQQLVTLAVPVVIGAALSVVLRVVFRSMFASSPQSYLSFDDIPASVQNLGESVAGMLATPEGSLKLLLISATLVLSWAVFAFSLIARTRPGLAARISTDEVFVVAFVTASSVSLVLGQIVTGAVTTRYFAPLVIFPLVSVISVGVYLLRRLLVEVKGADLRKNLSQFLVFVSVAASAVIVTLGALSVPAVARAADGVGYTGADCFNAFVGNRDINGVGSFWAVRPLDLYGDTSGVVLQADEDLDLYAWMNNVGSYEDKTFSYAVTDSTGQLPASSLRRLGDPSRVVSCSGFDIYDYEGTPGEALLTESIARSLDDFRGP